MPVELLQESEDFRATVEGVYPDNWQAYNVFLDMITQWRMGPTGITGLDYNALPVVFRLRRIKDREDIFNCIQVMERAALQRVVERRDQGRR